MKLIDSRNNTLSNLTIQSGFLDEFDYGASETFENNSDSVVTVLL